MPSYFLYRIIRFICVVIFKICFGFRIDGGENIPKQGSFIIASNHSSYLDPIAVAISVPQVVRFMAREDLFTVPVLGFLIKNVGTYPVKRGYQDFKAVKDSLKLLKGGEVIGMFPEGTRIEGPELGSPELGICMLAAHSEAPVLPVFVEGSREALPRHAKFIRPRRVKVHIGEPLRFKECKDNSARKEAYREFSDRVMQSIKSLSRGSQ